MDNTNINKLPYVAAKIDKVMNTDSNLKAFATITISGCFMVHNIKVMNGKKGLFVTMPSQSYSDASGNTKYTDICHSINSEMKQRIDSMVLAAYNQELTKNSAPTVAPTVIPTAPTIAPEFSNLDDVELPFYMDDGPDL